MSQLFLVRCPECKAEVLFASLKKEKWICYFCGKDLEENGGKSKGDKNDVSNL